MRDKKPNKEMTDVSERTLICRCEDITQKEIRALIAEGYTTAEAVSYTHLDVYKRQLLIAQELSAMIQGMAKNTQNHQKIQ